MIRYENRQFWRQVPSGGRLDYASSAPTQAVTAVLATVAVVVRAEPVNDDGEAGEPFLVGVAQPGETAIKVRHMSGFVLSFEYAKGGECWVYDDREDHQAVAPVGVSFTVFEQPGHIFNDPVQLLIQRDANMKALQRMAARDNPQPDRMAELEAANKRLLDRLDKMDKEREQEAANREPEPSAPA